MEKRTYNFEKVKAVLEKWKQEQIFELKSFAAADKSVVEIKIQIERAIKCLELCEEYQIVPEKILAIHELPYMKTGYFEYRIMNDCEVDQRDMWIELKVDDEPLRVIPGDLIIEKKSK